jgi:hypothetical protein
MFSDTGYQAIQEWDVWRKENKWEEFLACSARRNGCILLSRKKSQENMVPIFGCNRSGSEEVLDHGAMVEIHGVKYWIEVIQKEYFKAINQCLLILPLDAELWGGVAKRHGFRKMEGRGSLFITGRNLGFNKEDPDNSSEKHESEMCIFKEKKKN